MAEKKIEMNLSALGGIHKAFAEIAQHCAEAGVRIERVDFDWFTHSIDFSGNKPGPILINTRITSDSGLQKGD